MSFICSIHLYSNTSQTLRERFSIKHHLSRLKHIMCYFIQAANLVHWYSHFNSISFCSFSYFKNSEIQLHSGLSIYNFMDLFQISIFIDIILPSVVYICLGWNESFFFHPDKFGHFPLLAFFSLSPTHSRGLSIKALYDFLQSCLIH